MNVIPISEVEIDTILDTLWQPLDTGEDACVFAVLDGARNKRIEPMLNNGDLDYACLYSGPLSYALQRAAPHIVKLERHDPLTRKIIKMGWGNSWGIFFICKAGTPLAVVRNNCRRISKVKSPEGKTLVFRYYDPRVLRMFLPTCDSDSLMKIMGQASIMVAEAETGNKLIKYRISKHDLSLQKEHHEVFITNFFESEESF